MRRSLPDVRMSHVGDTHFGLSFVTFAIFRPLQDNNEGPDTTNFRVKLPLEFRVDSIGTLEDQVKMRQP